MASASPAASALVEGALGFAATRAAFFLALLDRDRLLRFAGALGLLATRAAAFRDRDRLLDPLRRLLALGLDADRAAFLERERERDFDLPLLGDLAFLALPF